MLYITKLIFLKVLMLIRQMLLRNLLYRHYYYFLDEGFKFQSTVCNGCHDVLMMSIDINNTAILNIPGVN